MDILIILCFVQALTEFLPVSSTAHIIMVEKILGIQSTPELWNIGLHLGTFFSILLYYIKDVYFLVTHFIKGALSPPLRKSEYFWTATYLLIATFPAILAGFLIKPFLSFLHNNLHLIAISSIIFGSLLAYVDLYQNENDEKLILQNSLAMGFAQLFAFLPGGSRLGTTITAARLMGLSRYESFRYSMLLSLPVVFGAVTLMLKDAIRCDYFVFNNSFLIATITTFFLGFFILSLIQHIIPKIGFAVFGIYRILLGCFILGLLYLGIF